MPNDGQVVALIVLALVAVKVIHYFYPDDITD